MNIRSVWMADAALLCTIYNHYVANTVVTFEEAPVFVDDMRARIDAVLAKLPWLVLEHEGAIAGYAYAASWKSRVSYRFAVESSIYLAPGHTGRGMGFRLYRALLDALRERNVHCVIAGAALPNPASTALHEKLGFEQIAHFRQVGWKFDRWIDVVYWQLILRAHCTSSP